MSLLVAPSSVANRLLINLDVPDYADAVNSAVRAATARTLGAGRYPPPDVYEERSDVFYVPHRLRPFENFLLARGFAQTITAVRASNTPAGLWTPNQHRDLQALSGAYLGLDCTRGFLTIGGADLRDEWVAISYSGGLKVDVDEVYENVPAAMASYAEARAVLALRGNALFGSDDLQVFEEARHEAATSLSAFIRAVPGALTPQIRA